MRLLSLKSIGRFNIHPPAQISSLQRNCFSLSKSFFVHYCVYDFHSSFTFITIFHYYNFLLLYSLSLQLWGFSFWGKQYNCISTVTHLQCVGPNHFIWSEVWAYSIPELVETKDYYRCQTKWCRCFWHHSIEKIKRIWIKLIFSCHEETFLFDYIKWLLLNLHLS